jgi:hypothetical protein
MNGFVADKKNVADKDLILWPILWQIRNVADFVADKKMWPILWQIRKCGR